ncbi:MAG: ABC transporter ATP-binding protein [Chloroflexi bacterium]|nr:ABC transporter ATP-binding protein [Chloroflexota bacterium]NOG62192.1 ABC transporter ATP-binding protein [Chloroflexota bacterium]
MIVLKHVSKRYQMGAVTVTALNDVSLNIEEGEFVVVLGPSGSGKTTLLNMISALDTPTEGIITVADQDITAMSRLKQFDFRRNTVSFIFQSFNLFPSLTAEENVQFVLDMHYKRGIQSTAKAVLDSVGLGLRYHHFPHELSGGEQQRVAIARALATGNPVLLADEPTGELDFKTGVQILQLLRSQAGNRRTVLVVTHNREISRIADRVIELSSGEIVRDGAPEAGKAPIAELHW